MKTILDRLKIHSSINRFLLISILSFSTLYVGAIYGLSHRQAIHEIEELFDAQLAQSSFILLNLLGGSVSTIDQSSKHLPVVYYGLEDTFSGDFNAKMYQKKVAYQIYNGQGKLLIKSGSAPDAPLARNKTGFSRIDLIDSDPWRVFSIYDEDWDFWLHVAESDSIREELAGDISRQTLLSGLVIFPFALVLLVFIIRSGLKPLKQLAENIQRREAKNLSPIVLQHTPKEMQPVMQALNDLFFRLEGAIKREQRLTADAAHELRTPLSVIMIHAQNALNAQQDDERDTALKEIEKGVMRVSRLLEQLLTLSKISPDTIPMETLTFFPLCQEVVAQMAPKMLAKNQDVALLCDSHNERLLVNGSAFLLEILIRNLIDNASQYTPSQGIIELSIKRDAGLLVLTVEDSGPGVAEDKQLQLTDRFYREHQQAGSGAGLGLALVNSIVLFHGGELQFSASRLGGLNVQVSVPIAQVTSN